MTYQISQSAQVRGNERNEKSLTSLISLTAGRPRHRAIEGGDSDLGGVK